MQEMLNQILQYTYTYPATPPADEEAIAHYLMGQAPIEAVSRLINPKAYAYYSKMDRDLQAIAEAALNEAGILERLGRHLKLASYADRAYSVLISYYANLIPPKSLFFSSGLGVFAYLKWAGRDNMPLSQTQELYMPAWEADKEGAIAALEKLDREDRYALAAFIMKMNGEEPFGKKKGFISKLVSGPGQSASEIFNADFAYFTRRGFKGTGGLSAFLKQAEIAFPDARSWFLDKAAQSPQAGQSRNSANRDFEKAFAMAKIYGSGSPGLNAVMKAAFIAGYAKLIPIWAKFIGVETKIDGLDDLKAIEGPLSESLAAFGLGDEWAASWLFSICINEAKSLRPMIGDLYKDRLGTLKKASFSARPPESIAIDICIGEKSSEQIVQAARDCFKKALLGASMPNEMRAALYKWVFDGEGRENASLEKGLPNEAINAAVLMKGIHPAFERVVCLVYEYGHRSYFSQIDCLLAGFFGMSPLERGRLYASIASTPSLKSKLMGIFKDMKYYAENNPELKQAIASTAKFMASELKESLGYAEDADTRLFIAECLFSSDEGFDDDFAIHLLLDKSVKIRRLAQAYLAPKKSLMEKILPLAESKRKDVREAASQLLAGYGSEGAAEQNLGLAAKCQRALSKNAQSSIAWAFPGGIPEMRYKGEEKAAESEIALYYIYSCLQSTFENIPPLCLEAGEALNEDDRHLAAVQCFEGWVSIEAPAKRKSALVLYGLNIRPEGVIRLEKQISDWSSSSRGAIAAEAVKALAISGTNFGLMAVDTLSRSAKNRQVKNAAALCFEQTAKNLGTTAEALGDRVVPNLGFDRYGVKELTYGPRSFKAILTNTLAIKLEAEGGKEVKSLPKPAASDDPVKAQSAKDELAQLKKSLKTVVMSQKARLESALTFERYWKAPDWKALFVENPIMQQFAVSLVWGQYENGQLIRSFRYMEDGGFTTSDEDEYEMGDEAVIGLAHPVELKSEAVSDWKQQFEDYEIEQPFAQLDRGVFQIEGGEGGKKTLDRFAGVKLPAITLATKLLAKGWRRGALSDHGDYYSFWGQFGEVEAELKFTGYFAGYSDPSLEAVVGQLGFYKAGAVSQEGYSGGAEESDLIELGSVPQRPFSEAAYVLSTIISGSEKDEAWMANPTLVFSNAKKKFRFGL